MVEFDFDGKERSVIGFQDDTTPSRIQRNALDRLVVKLGASEPTGRKEPCMIDHFSF